ncbi:MAG: hypothetical protein WC763_05465 [Candidatus Paceibacterota bacterium]|jgi:hypothetical protein
MSTAIISTHSHARARDLQWFQGRHHPRISVSVVPSWSSSSSSASEAIVISDSQCDGDECTPVQQDTLPRQMFPEEEDSLSLPIPANEETSVRITGVVSRRQRRLGPSLRSLEEVCNDDTTLPMELDKTREQLDDEADERRAAATERIRADYGRIFSSLRHLPPPSNYHAQPQLTQNIEDAVVEHAMFYGDNGNDIAEGDIPLSSSSSSSSSSSLSNVEDEADGNDSIFDMLDEKSMDIDTGRVVAIAPADAQPRITSLSHTSTSSSRSLPLPSASSLDASSMIAHVENAVMVESSCKMLAESVVRSVNTSVDMYFLECAQSLVGRQTGNGKRSVASSGEKLRVTFDRERESLKQQRRVIQSARAQQLRLIESMQKSVRMLEQAEAHLKDAKKVVTSSVRSCISIN